jgi:hypothetical protein
MASRRVSGGRIDGMRFAIIDFPEPGGPSNSTFGSIPDAFLRFYTQGHK